MRIPFSHGELIMYSLTFLYGTKMKADFPDPNLEHFYNHESILVAYKLLYGREAKSWNKALQTLSFDGLWQPKYKRLNPSELHRNHDAEKFMKKPVG